MQLGEVILYVQNMQAQVEFYRDLLGLDVLHPADLTDYTMEHYVEFDTGACTLCLQAGGAGKQGEDAPRIVFHMEEVEAARDALLDMGVRLGELRSPYAGITTCDGTDPEGNPFSLERRLT